MRAAILYGLFLLSILLLLFNCHSEETPIFKNAEPGKANYVGMETCKSCHLGIYNTFIQTGMGQSWGLANKQKSAADFSSHKAIVYDSVKNFYYRPYWDGDSLAILEYRLLGKDTIHKRIEKVSYIVGSGQHTNSHIINTNGYLHQAPITFYTQKGKWDLAPGFEKGMNTRFDRKIEMECISCHNGYPNFIEGSLNKYANIPLGIDCERCHGPGSLHVADKQAGNIIDTAKFTDYTIVNPKKLSTEQQNNLCQRCHLQGIAVLNDGKSFVDFLPSNDLKKTMNVFMPSYSGDENHMIMASHVERMKMSQCFINSGKMSCITCHNPHVSVKFTPTEQYTNACKSCHENKATCTEKMAVRMAKKDNCMSCHMPKNGSIDIPHVAVTDHYIRRSPQLESKDKIVKFIKMICYNNKQPDARTRARAFLEFYERYESKLPFIDSAFQYLSEAKVDIEKDADGDLIRAYFLQENYTKILFLVQSSEPGSFNNAWTCYRIGESYLRQKNTNKAIAYFEEAVRLKPLALDFQYKLGNAFLESNKLEAAKKVFNYILRENAKHAKANAGLGYIAMQENDLPSALQYLKTSLMLDPDQVQTLINLAVVLHQTKQVQFIRPILNQALLLDPSNVQVKAMLSDI